MAGIHGARPSVLLLGTKGSTPPSSSFGFSFRHSIAFTTTRKKKGFPQCCHGRSQYCLYGRFADVAIQQGSLHASLHPLPSQEEFRTMVSLDGKTKVENIALQSSKIRFFRVTTIDGGESMQVLNMAIFPREEYDLPIFCADFFSTKQMHIIVLDLNPLYDTEKNKVYKQKYYPQLMPLVNKYSELLPWGKDVTRESIQFFSPLVIWTKLKSKQDVQETLFSAFQDYLKAWLISMEKAEKATDPLEIARNKEAQHRYLLWRATKDPGRPILSRLFGEQASERFIREFLFDGVASMGERDFLHFFPHYRCIDGSMDTRRSPAGKSFSNRPWDKNGTFIGE